MTSRYNDVHVWQRADGVDFEVAGGTHATWQHDRVMTGYAWDAITAAALLRPGPSPRSILMLGLGGGTAIRQLRLLLPGTRITAVEIDPGMVDLARRYMHLDELDIEIVIDDAYDYVLQQNTLFDVVIDDVYLGGEGDVSRPVEYSNRLIETLKNRCNPDGSLLANLVTGDGHQQTQRTVRNAFRSHFDHVYSVRSAKGFNETILGLDSPGSAAALAAFETRFAHPLDALDWQGIRVKRLSTF